MDCENYSSNRGEWIERRGGGIKCNVSLESVIV